MKNFVIIILSILFIQHCEPYIVFDNPQPLNKPNKENFSKKYQGIYLNEDSVELIITKKMILKRSVEYFDILKAEFDTMQNYSIQGEFIFGPDIDSARIIEIRNDTIFGNYIFKDTLFILNSREILKKYKNNYFLNLQQDDETWEVILMELKNNTLQIKSLSEEEDIDYLKNNFKVDEVINDSTKKVSKYIIRVNNKEFANLCKYGGFKDIESWQKKEQ